MGTKMGLVVVDTENNKLVEVIGSEKKLLGELCMHISKGMYHQEPMREGVGNCACINMHIILCIANF